MLKCVPVFVTHLRRLWFCVQNMSTEYHNCSDVSVTWRSVVATPALAATTNPVEVFKLALACLRIASSRRDLGISSLLCMALDVLGPVLRSTPDLVVSWLDEFIYCKELLRKAFGMGASTACLPWGSSSGKMNFDRLWNVGLGAGLPVGHALHYRRCTLREGIRQALTSSLCMPVQHLAGVWQYLSAVAEVTGETESSQFIHQACSLGVEHTSAWQLQEFAEVIALCQCINSRWGTIRSAWVGSVARGVQHRTQHQEREKLEEAFFTNGRPVKRRWG
jgi:hypothetical protein